MKKPSDRTFLRSYVIGGKTFCLEDVKKLILLILLGFSF